MPSLPLKGLLVEIRGTAMEQLWHSSNLPFNRGGSENRTGVSFFFLQKGSMNPNFLHLFLFGDTKRLGGGEEVQEKKYTHTERNK